MMYILYLVVYSWFTHINAAQLETHASYEDNVLRSSTDEDIFKSDLNHILVERTVASASHEKVKQYITDTLTGLEWHVEPDEFISNTPYGNKQFTNVIATHNKDADYRLVFACHYDTKMYDKINFLGAIDSAVPCAMLINLARKLNNKLKENKNADLTLQLIFFDGEEAFVQWSDTDSTFGSRYLAKQWGNTPWTSSKGDSLTEINRIELLVLLDLLGAANPQIPNYFQNTKNEFNKLVNIQTKLDPPQHYFVDKQGYTISDDHLPFLTRHVPILHVIPTPFPSVWHTEYDNMAALDFQTIGNLNKIFIEFVSDYLQL